MSKDYIPYDQVPAPETTADRRRREALTSPVILYGTPSQGEIAQARGAGRGVLVLPDEMRGRLIGVHPGFEGDGLVSSEWLGDDLRTTTEKEADENAKQARDEIPEWREREKLYESREADLDLLWKRGVIDEQRHKILREQLREEFGYDQEEHTHYTERASRLCAEGDHDSAELWDRDAERVKVREHEAVTGLKPGTTYYVDVNGGVTDEMTTMAEEPIESRLRRAWLNGFKEGVERASYSATESWGRWDS